MSAERAAAEVYRFDNAESWVGREIGVSPWLKVDQREINVFGEITHDPDPNHIDPNWAAIHSPFGQTVAFGFQTLAYLTYLGKQAGMLPAGVAGEVNYGLERVRLVEPVVAGARIRAFVSLKSVVRRSDQRGLFTYGVHIEIEGKPKPALVCDWLTLLSPAGAAHA